MITAILSFFGYAKRDESFAEMMSELQTTRDNGRMKFIGYVELNEIYKNEK